jgi:hypothetical protein
MMMMMMTIIIIIIIINRASVIEKAHGLRNYERINEMINL